MITNRCLVYTGPVVAAGRADEREPDKQRTVEEKASDGNVDELDTVHGEENATPGNATSPDGVGDSKEDATPGQATSPDFLVEMEGLGESKDFATRGHATSPEGSGDSKETVDNSEFLMVARPKPLATAEDERSASEETVRSLPEESGGNDPVPSVREAGDDSPLMGFANKVRMKRKGGLEPFPEDPIDDSSLAPKTTQEDISGTAKGENCLQIIALHGLNWATALTELRKRRIAESRKIKRERAENCKRWDRVLSKLSRILEYLNFVHPSGEVIFLEWLPPLVVPKPLEEEKRALILDLNGLLVHVVEPRHGEVIPHYEEELYKYMGDGRIVFCRKDSHRFLDWCLQFFHVYVWSTSMGRKVNAILRQVFSPQLARMGGSLSQEHCAQWHWKLHNKPVFFKHLSQFWRINSDFGPTNTLIIDDSKYKVWQNPKGTWLVLPKIEDQSPEERQSFLIDKLAPWLFLWLQSEDRRTYTENSVYDIYPDWFSDAVVKKVEDEQLQEKMRERQTEDLRQYTKGIVEEAKQKEKGKAKQDSELRWDELLAKRKGNAGGRKP